MTHDSATYDRGCRCPQCRRANATRVALWQHRTRYGAVPVRVPIGPVRDHVIRLRATGWTLREIASEADISFHTVKAVTANTVVKKYVTREVADRILAVEPLTPVTVDPVVVERLVAGADWRAIGATRQERIEAAERMPSRAEAERRLGLRAGRDFAVRGVA